nr:hypothetical protein [Desulfobulbaceae bacterium]
MDYEFEDIITAAQVSEDFAFDSGESFDSDLTLEEIDTPIKALKVIILSIDWEITPEILDNYQQEIKRLENLWAQDNIALAFLRILGALGIYIKTCQASAHPDAVKLLYSVYNGLEKSTISKEMTTAAKVELVQAELRKYNTIRAIIKEANTAAARKAASKPATGETPAAGGSLAKESAYKEVAEPEEPLSGAESEEITPALAGVPRPAAGDSRQWSFQEVAHDQDVEGSSATVSQLGDEGGVVALPQSSSLEEPDADANQQANIFDDLFASKPSTPADDLLLQMHMPADKKGAGAQGAKVVGSEEEVTETLTLVEQTDTDFDRTDHGEEISNRLDSFFGDDDSSATVSQGEDEGGVVPLPAAQMEAPIAEVKSAEVDAQLAAIAELKEIVEASVSSGQSADYSKALSETLELLADNKVALMLLEALDSTLTTLRDTNTSITENGALLRALCDLASEAIAASGQPDLGTTVAIFEEMRKYIALQDTVIRALLDNTQD